MRALTAAVLIAGSAAAAGQVDSAFGAASAASPASTPAGPIGFIDVGPSLALGAPRSLSDDGQILFAKGYWSNGVLTAPPTPDGANGPMTVNAMTGTGFVVGEDSFGNGSNDRRIAYWNPGAGTSAAYPAACTDNSDPHNPFSEYADYVLAASSDDEIAVDDANCVANDSTTPSATVPHPGSDAFAAVPGLNDVYALRPNWAVGQQPGDSTEDPPALRLNRLSGTTAPLPVNVGIDSHQLAADGTVVGDTAVAGSNQDGPPEAVAPNGTVTRLGLPKGYSGTVAAINDHDVSVGNIGSTESNLQLVEWPSPTSAPVNLSRSTLIPAGWTELIGVAINNHQDVLGVGKAPNGVFHTFLLGPETTTRLACPAGRSVGTFTCTATVSSPSAADGAPAGSVRLTATVGAVGSGSCSLVKKTPTTSACSATFTPTGAANAQPVKITATDPTTAFLNGSHASMTIAPVEVTVSAKSVHTYLAGSDDATFTVKLSRAANTATTVDYRTADGAGPNGARAGEGEYRRTSGTLRFAPGQIEKTIEVTCYPDITLRKNADFDLVLSALSGATFGSSTGRRSNRIASDSPTTNQTVREVIDPNLLAGKITVVQYADRKRTGTPRLWVKRYNTLKIVRINRGDKVYVGDEITVDKDGVAGIQFTLGGRIGINQGTTAKVVSERSTAQVDGNLCSVIRHKIDIVEHVSTQKTPVLIQTNGGVMGIKG